MDSIEILKQLELMLSDKKGVFGKKVDTNKCLEVLQDALEQLPNNIMEADYIVSNRQAILDNADKVAKNVIKEAEEHSARIIDNSELMRRAEVEAKKMIDNAMVQCEILVQKTKDHLDDIFKNTEQFLLSALAMIRNNREELRGAMIINNEKKS